MNKKWVPFAVAGIVVGVGLVVWQVVRMSSGGAEASAPTEELIKTLPKPPAGAAQELPPIDPRIMEGPEGMPKRGG
ncbi:MAG TPA: hypothetical protein PLL78_14875 [Fimbriimonadaceae bacterium]|nr:hypothetical protein [Fimbriimonadaceae bacterium]HRJ97956.1 hypothetical protein [Fimbriimonadaceae bacterium]